LDIYITQQVGNRKFNNEWFGRNQWLTANVAKPSLASYSVERVCGLSLSLRVTFSSLKGYDFCHVQNNWTLRTGKSRDFSEFKTTRNPGKKSTSDWEKDVLNGHPTQNSKLGTGASL
jgi:hypothetical protein